MIEIIRWAIFITLLIFTYKHISWTGTILFSYLFIQGEMIWYTLRKNLPQAFENKVNIAGRKITKENLDQLSFSSESLSLTEAILLDKVGAGNLSALNEFLRSRCLDKTFNFENVPIEFLHPLANRITLEINEKYKKLIGESKDLIPIIKNPTIH